MAGILPKNTIYSPKQLIKAWENLHHSENTTLAPICESTDGRCREIPQDTYNQTILCMGFLGGDSSNPHFKWTGDTKDGFWGIHITRQERKEFSQEEKDAWRKQKAEQAAKARKLEAEALEKAKNETLTIEQIDEIYLGLAKKFTLSQKHRDNLLNRGLKPNQVDAFPTWSVAKGEVIADVPLSFPGCIKPRRLGFTDNGFLCPSFALNGKVNGYQTRYDRDDNKYTWGLGGHNKILVNGSLELPITHLGIKPDNTQVLYLCEGIAKPYIAHQKLGKAVLGASGGNFTSSPEQVKLALQAVAKTLKVIKVVPDAGDTKNPQVMRRWLRQYEFLKKLIKELGLTIKIEFLWWGQADKKKDKDFDEFKPLAWLKMNAKGIEPHKFFESILNEQDRQARQSYRSAKVSEKTPTFFYAPDSDKLYICQYESKAENYKQQGFSVSFLPNFDIRKVTKELMNLPATIKTIVFDLPERIWEKEGATLDWISYLTRTLRGYVGMDHLLNPQDSQFLEIDNPDDEPSCNVQNILGTVVRDGQTVSEIEIGYITALGNVDAPRNAIKTRQDKLDPLDPHAVAGKVVCIKSPKGTGKTYQAKKLIEARGDKSHCLFIAPSIRLNEQIAASIPNCVSRNHAKGDKDLKDYIYREDVYSRVATCVHSMGKFKDREYVANGVVVLDEIETISRLLFRDRFIKNTSLYSCIKETIRAITETIENGGTVILSDADLSETTIQLFMGLCGLSDDQVMRMVNEPNNLPAYPLTVLEYPGEIKNSIVNILEQGKKAFLVTDSAKEAEVFAYDMVEQFPDKKILLLTAETAETDDAQAFLANPNQYLHDNHIRLLISSPVVSTGFSIEMEGLFDEVFGAFNGVVKPDEARQALMRYRPSVPRSVWAKERAIKPSDIPAYSYKQDENIDSLEDIYAERLSSIYQDRVLAKEIRNHFDPNILTYIAAKGRKDYQQSYQYRDAVIGGLALLEGCLPTNGDTDEVLDEITLGSYETRKLLEELEAERIGSAKLLPLESREYEKLKAKFNKSKEDLAQIIKAETSAKLDEITPIDKDFASTYLVKTSGKKRLRNLKKACAVTNLELFRDVAHIESNNLLNSLKANKAAFIPTNAINLTYLEARTLRGLGVHKLLELLKEKDSKAKTVPLDLDSELVTNIYRRYIKNRGFYEKRLNRKFKTNFRVNKKEGRKFSVISGLLEMVGIRLSKTGKEVIEKLEIVEPYLYPKIQEGFKQVALKVVQKNGDSAFAHSQNAYRQNEDQQSSESSTDKDYSDLKNYFNNKNKNETEIQLTPITTDYAKTEHSDSVASYAENEAEGGATDTNDDVEVTTESSETFVMAIETEIPEPQQTSQDKEDNDNGNQSQVAKLKQAMLEYQANIDRGHLVKMNREALAIAQAELSKLGELLEENVGVKTDSLDTSQSKVDRLKQNITSLASKCRDILMNNTGFYYQFPPYR